MCIAHAKHVKINETNKNRNRELSTKPTNIITIII